MELEQKNSWVGGKKEYHMRSLATRIPFACEEANQSTTIKHKWILNDSSLFNIVDFKRELFNYFTRNE